MKNATFYHAGCDVCVRAERALVRSIDPASYRVEVVHLGEQKGRLDEAERAGVRSVPALVIDGAALHINYGAALADLR